MGDSWIGGDIDGLHAMGSTLKAAKEQLDAVVRPLSSGVESLVRDGTDAGWRGRAANSFRKKWIADAEAAGGFADLVEATGRILSDLADNLRAANSALQDAADIATRKGVPVGPSGEPGQWMAPQNDNSPAQQSAVCHYRDYVNAYNEITHKAQQARIDAAQALDKLYAAIDPYSPMPTGDKIVVADLLRALWTAKTDEERKFGLTAAKSLPDAQHKHEAALKALQDEEAKFKTAEKNLPKAFRLKEDYRAAASELDRLDTRLAQAESGSDFLPYDRELNYKLADAFKGAELVEGAPEFLKEIPVIDVAATVAAGGLEARDDHDKGWSWAHSLAVDVGGGLAALGAGALAVVAVPEEVIAGGAVGATAVGTGVVLETSLLFDHALHEHWSEDIHDQGVVDGTLHGASNVVLGSLQQTGKLVSEPMKGLWHGVTSLF